jgi:hypothetical protein
LDAIAASLVLVPFVWLLLILGLLFFRVPRKQMFTIVGVLMLGSWAFLVVLIETSGRKFGTASGSIPQWAMLIYYSWLIFGLVMLGFGLFTKRVEKPSSPVPTQN